MPPQSSPLNPNARPFPYPPPHLRPSSQSPLSRFAHSPSRSLAPLTRLGPVPNPPPPPRLSPLAPIPCDVLDRGRTHNFGPEDPLPRFSNAVERIQAASNQQWVRHRTGQPPLVRPGSVVAPQTIYTGRSVRPNGQEIHHAVLLNSRLLIHNPLTGRPGMVNGHAVTTLVAVPPDDSTWPFEIPFPGVHHVDTLSTYGPATQAEIGRQRRAGNHQLDINRQVVRLPSETAGSVEDAPSTPALRPVPLPPISRARQSLPFRQPLPSFQAVLRSTQNRVEPEARTPFFLTHPPNVLPRVDTRNMTHRGTALDTGHRVLQLPTQTTTSSGTGLPRRIDTPAPPLRLLTGPPVIVEDHTDSASDASMPPVSPKEPDNDPDTAVAATSTTVAQGASKELESGSPTVQKWAVLNARLERLHYEARRCVMAHTSPDKQTPRYVFGAYPAPGGANDGNKEEESAAQGTDEMDVDPSSVDEGESKRDGAQSSGTASLIPEFPLSRVRSSESWDSEPASPLPGPRGHLLSPLSSLSSSASSSQDALSSTSDDKVSPSDQHESSTESAHHSTSASHDCRSTRNSPRPQAHLPGDESDSDSPPPLVTSPSEEDESQEEESQDDSNALVPYNPGPTTNVNPQELQGYLTRIVRAPPTPSNHNWILVQEWTRNQGAFLARLYSVENADAMAFLRKADALIRRFPEILDLQRMRVNELIDTDLVNVLQYPDITKESCAQFADRIQRVRDSINTYSPGLMDDTQSIHDIVYIPVSADGSRLRQLSDRAFKQPLMYRYAILLIVKQHLAWIAFYTELRAFVLAFIHYLDELFRRRRWKLDETLLHQQAPIPPPYLHPFEYQRLRVLHYTFGEHGQDEVVRAIDKFLRYRFRETEVVAHLLFSGLFETNDVVRGSDGGFKAVSPRKAPLSFRARIAARRCRVSLLNASHILIAGTVRLARQLLESHLFAARHPISSLATALRGHCISCTTIPGHICGRFVFTCSR
ncbi:hypothetical protein DFH06DRAFT_1349406 [Mycena polygramma]|nr:hypothetical protein DFH06DRAFT_1349406 [Mycena polygramma]